MSRLPHDDHHSVVISVHPFSASPGLRARRRGVRARRRIAAPGCAGGIAPPSSVRHECHHIVDAIACAAVRGRQSGHPATPYVALTYRQALTCSATYQARIVSWVAFWAVCGEGFDVSAGAAVGVFGAAYLSVVLLEPLLDVAVLAAAKSMRGVTAGGVLQPRLFGAPCSGVEFTR